MFKVRNQSIDASAAYYKEGKATDLAVGRKVAVKGPMVGGKLRATSVSFDESNGN